MKYEIDALGKYPSAEDDRELIRPGSDLSSASCR